MPMGISIATHDKPEPMLTISESIVLSTLIESVSILRVTLKSIVLKIM